MNIPIEANSDDDLIKVFGILSTLVSEEIVRGKLASAVRFDGGRSQPAQDAPGPLSFAKYESTASLQGPSGQPVVASLRWDRSQPSEILWQVTSEFEMWNLARFEEGWNSVAFVGSSVLAVGGAVAVAIVDWTLFKDLMSKKGWLAFVLGFIGLFLVLKYASLPYTFVRWRASERQLQGDLQFARSIKAAGDAAVNRLLASKAAGENSGQA